MRQTVLHSWRDPLVGREVLIGLSLGMVIYLLGPIGADAVAEVVGVADFPPLAHSWATIVITSPTMQSYALCGVVSTFLYTTLLVLLLLLVLRMLSGRVWGAITATLVLYMLVTRRRRPP